MTVVIGRWLFVSLFAAGLYAQTYGEITGTVTDSTGAAVAGAPVSITNIATNQIRQIETNTAGSYTVPFLVPGRYRIEAKVQGFKAAVADRNRRSRRAGRDAADPE